MYKSYSAKQYKKHLGFPKEYSVDGVLSYGTLYEDKIIGVLLECLEELGIKTDLMLLPHPFLRFARELKINDIRLWFMIGYGGAWLSEYLHWACLFGSKKNILVGSCGGLKAGMKSGDFIIPDSSFGEESSVKIYNRSGSVQYPDKRLSESLKKRLVNTGSAIWRGPIVTCQAMIGETIEDVQNWSKDGYYGVEMESSTVFAVSNHFNVPSTACMYVGDNLVEQQTNLSEDFSATSHVREKKQHEQLKAAIKLLIS